jgi:Domain of unknown function (DUF1816)
MELLVQPELPLAWWVEIYTSVAQTTYCLGPFQTKTEARISRGACVDALYHTNARDIVALIKQR